MSTAPKSRIQFSAPSHACTQPDVFASQVQRMLCDLLAAELRGLTKQHQPPRFRALRGASMPLLGDFTEALDLNELEFIACVRAVARFFNLVGTGAEPFLLAHKSVDMWTQIVLHSRAQGNRDLTFSPANPSGVDHQVRQPSTWLFQEVQHWAALLAQWLPSVGASGTNAGAAIKRIVACVPAHQAYGAIWTVGLPSLLQVPVEVLAPSQFAAQRFTPGDCVVAVPMLWQYAATHAQPFAKGVLGVTCGGTLSAELDATLKNTCGLDSLLHVYSAPISSQSCFELDTAHSSASVDAGGLAWSLDGGTSYEWLPYFAWDNARADLPTAFNEPQPNPELNPKPEIEIETAFKPTLAQTRQQADEQTHKQAHEQTKTRASVKTHALPPPETYASGSVHAQLIQRFTPEGFAVRLRLLQRITPISARQFQLGAQPGDVVHVGGQLVSLAWVGERMRQHLQVQDCAVRLDSHSGYLALKALVVRRHGLPADKRFLASVAKFANEALPAYAVPAFWTVGKEVAVNNLGKPTDWVTRF